MAEPAPGAVRDPNPNRRAVLTWCGPLVLLTGGMAWRQVQRRREERARMLREQQREDRQRQAGNRDNDEE